MSDNIFDILDIEEVGKLTKTPPATLRFWRHKGDQGPRSFKIGRRVMYRREDVERWMQEQYEAGVGA